RWCLRPLFAVASLIATTARESRRVVAPVTVTGLGTPVSEIVVSGHGVGVVGAKYLKLGGEQVQQVGDSTSRVSILPPPPGEYAVDCQGVGMVWAKHPQLVVE